MSAPRAALLAAGMFAGWLFAAEVRGLLLLNFSSRPVSLIEAVLWIAPGVFLVELGVLICWLAIASIRKRQELESRSPRAWFLAGAARSLALAASTSLLGFVAILAIAPNQGGTHQGYGLIRPFAGTAAAEQLSPDRLVAIAGGVQLETEETVRAAFDAALLGQLACVFLLGLVFLSRAVLVFLLRPYADASDGQPGRAVFDHIKREQRRGNFDRIDP